jgi:predicted PurR-regulated permease PerM
MDSSISLVVFLLVLIVVIITCLMLDLSFFNSFLLGIIVAVLAITLFAPPTLKLESNVDQAMFVVILISCLVTGFYITAGLFYGLITLGPLNDSLEKPSSIAQVSNFELVN